MKLGGIPNYQNLDVTGEALAAAERMEARAREPASERMFDALVRPLPGRVRAIGCLPEVAPLGPGEPPSAGGRGGPSAESTA